MFRDPLLLAAGLFAWTFLEYVIHGWMSHTLRTFVSPLHDVHHRDPHAVFTIGAWIPVAIVWATFFALFGAGAPTIFFSGMAGGFAIYEAIHYRLHFSSSLSGFEQVLRTRHLAHHHRAPDAIFGVTNSFWDRLLGSQPDAFRMQELQDAVAAVKPLQGPSNIRRIFFFGLAAR